MISNRIQLLKGDIIKIKCDVIVNAANSSLLGGGGVDGAIHRAGGRSILEECILIRNKQGKCNTGEAVITNAGNMPCKKVIHTVGPVWNGGKNNEDFLLKNCYVNSLKLALNNNLTTIAFPNISTGIYGFPKERAAKIAIDSIKEFLDSNTQIEKVIFVAFDNENYEIYQRYLT